MMDYLRAIVSIIFFSIPFSYILDFVFNIVQIPFALIHRYAARCVFVYKVYILCQFFAVLINANMAMYDIHPIAVLIVVSLIMWFMVSSAVHNSQKNDYETGSNNTPFVGIVSLISIPAVWAIYFLDISFLNHPVIWFFMLIDYLYGIPVIGSILKFFTRASTGWTILFFAFVVVVMVVILASKIIAAMKSKEKTKEV